MATPQQVRRRGRWSLILGTFFAFAALAAVAYADVVTINDVVTGGDAALTRGANGTANVTIASSNTDPTAGDASGCNATGAAPATVTVASSSVNVAVSAPASKSYSGCDTITPFGYSVASNAALGSLSTLSTSTSGGKAGSQYREDSFTVRVLPRAASNLIATANGATQIDLSWTASPDATDLTDYEIFDGVVKVASAAKGATSASATGLDPGSSHCYTIKARYYDGTSNWFSAASGGSGAACATTVSDSTPPVITRVIAGTSGSNGWYTSDVTVSWSVVDNESTATIVSGCGVQNFTSETTSVTSSCSASSAGGAANDSVTLKIDKTGPSAALAVTAGDPGANGWYTSDVTIRTSGSDSISSPVTCSADQTQSTETAGEVFNGSCTNDAGLTTNAASLTVKLDKTGPTAALAVTAGTLGSNGWYTSDVTVDTSGSDAISSPVTCSADQTQSTETAGEVFNGSCTNDAGLTTNAASLTVKLDKTAPTVALVGGPGNGASYYFGSVPATPTCTASDLGPSGLDGFCSVSGYGTNVGSHTVSASAKDLAGNVGNSASNSYTVLAWTLNGFYQPVDMGMNVFNTVKSGATVPLKFRVFAGSTELTDVSAVKSMTATKIACATGVAEDPIEELAPTGGTVLRYDATGGQFIYNWQTPKTAGQCYRVTMTTQDGSSLVAFFKLK